MITGEFKPFYLTGDTPLFKVEVYNPGAVRRHGKIALIWKLENLSTTQIINIDLRPREIEEYGLNREWLYTEGVARYDLRNLEEPEEYAELSDNILMKIVKNVHDIDPLCSYYVRDRGMYKYKKAEQDQILKSLDKLLCSVEKLYESSNKLEKLTRWLIFLTIILTILTIILAKKDIIDMYDYLINSSRQITWITKLR